MSSNNHNQDSYRYGGMGTSGVPGGVPLNAGSGGFGGDKYDHPATAGTGASARTEPHEEHGSFRYGGMGYSGVPGGVALNAGSGGFGGDKYDQQSAGDGNLPAKTHPKESEGSYRYGGMGTSGVPGGVAILPGSGGFGGDYTQSGGAGGVASDGSSHHHSHHHGQGGAGGDAGTVAPGTGHAHHKHEHHDEERR